MAVFQYDNYPLHNQNLPVDLFDRAVYSQRLSDDSGRLFSASEIDMEIITRKIETHLESTLEQLSQSEGLEVFFIIKQLDSWNFILSSSSAMKRLLSHFDVFPRFLDYLQAFGLRHNEIGEDLPTISLQRDNSRNGLLEICYSIRYPAEHGRRSDDPWSIRQTAIYYQYNNSKDVSMSLLIQPSKELRSQIDLLLKSDSSLSCKSFTIQHATFVSSGMSWKQYTSHMEKTLNILEEKAYFSKVGIPTSYDYPLAFKDYQNIQRLRKKLLKTREILEANLEVIKRYQMAFFPQNDSSVDALDWCSSGLRSSQRTVDRLLQNANAVGETLLCILKYRNEEITRATTTAIHENGQLLTKLATLANQNADAVSKLTIKAQKDSRATKILTVVASLYLPTSLVASIFNSNLVATVTTQGDESNQGHFIIASEFWMFPIFTIALMFLTLLPVWIWVRRLDSTKTRSHIV